ncbi:SRPBCC family protein [Streptomyces sp. 4F14]|uniref:SRPBCC family protein n=1 Tax=Streptomyces sp. 4F14 TaxID=3394380 RepID=UPI003A859E1D
MTDTLSGVARSEAADRLKAEVREYVAAQAQRLLVGAGHKLGETTVKLNDIASGESPGFARLALDGGRKLAEGKGPLRSALEVGAGRAKDNVKEALKGLGKKGKGKSKGAGGKKPTVVMEHVDVGVPLRTAYDQWTRFQDFGSFAKGVKSADRADDTRSDWRLKVFWSSRSWQAMTTEQVPDDRIAWTSQGAKGTTKGVVTFHRLAENLTRVLLVVEYYPAGLFERTGNLWRAQGRRVRLDLKNYARFITLKGEAEDGWRGEIHDGKVVVSHEDAVAEETEDGEEPQDEYEEEDEPRDEYEDEETDEDEDQDQDAESEDAEGELEYDEEDEGGEPDEADEEPDDDTPAADDTSDDEAPARDHRSRR